MRNVKSDDACDNFDPFIIVENLILECCSVVVIITIMCPENDKGIHLSSQVLVLGVFRKILYHSLSSLSLYMILLIFLHAAGLDNSATFLSICLGLF